MKNIRRLTLTAAALVLGLALAGCGSQDNAGNGGNGGNGGQAAGPGEGNGPGQGGGAGFGGPGGSGKVAAVSGKTAQVQGMNSQVAVTWTNATTFTQQVSAKASDLEVGDCVVALPDFQQGGSGSSTSSSDSAVAAASVRISTATKGSCATQGFGGGGFRGSRPNQGGGSGEAPNGAPSGAPSGGPGGGRGVGIAFGEVTAVSGSSFTVKSVRPSADGGSATSTNVSVTTTSKTKWTRQTTAAAKDVKVGVCVTTAGKSGSTGAITATSMAISKPENGSCTAAFGSGRGMGRPGDQGNEGQSS